MADADQQDKTPGKQSNEALSGIKEEIAASLAEMTNQIKAMNEQYQAGLQTVVSAVQPKREEAVTEDDIFEPAKLQQKVTERALEVTNDFLRKEQEKTILIGKLAQDYPEIQSDSKLIQAVLAEQKKLPKGMQQSAEGYEMAVLRAVANQGLIPKSKRKSEEAEADVSFGNSRTEARENRRTKKVSEKTVAFAELLRGRELTDDELKGLEKATNRDTYNRYR